MSECAPQPAAKNVPSLVSLATVRPAAKYATKWRSRVADEGPKPGCWHSERTGVQGHIGLQQEKQQNPSSPLGSVASSDFDFWRFWLCRRSGGSSTQGSWHAGVQGGGAVAQEALKSSDRRRPLFLRFLRFLRSYVLHISY